MSRTGDCSFKGAPQGGIKCSAPRIDFWMTVEVGGSPLFQVTPDGRTRPYCKAHQYAGTNTCQNCGSPRPEKIEERQA